MPILPVTASVSMAAILLGVSTLATQSPQLALDRDFPDPDIIKVDGTYYVYSTNAGGRTLPAASATSIDGPWTVQAEEALPRLGAWASPGFTWAPDVSRRKDGTFLLYYTARNTDPARQCIGAALADSPRGPFVPVGTKPLVCPIEEGGAIDASSFVESNGKRYLLYKNDGNAIGEPTTIWLQPVGPDGITFTGPRVPLVSNDANEGWLVEAPVLVKHGSTYVLTYATGEYWNDTYATRYATASRVDGPYTKVDRPLLSTDGFDGAVAGPGGADIIRETAGDHIVFHGVRDGGYRALYVAELGWASEGVPVVRGMRNRMEAEAGTLNHCTVRKPVSSASGDAVAAYIDYDDSWVDFRVYAPRSGSYTAKVGYANGSVDGSTQQAATHRVYVNGTAAGTVTYPFTGWDNWQEAAIDVQLSEGWNTIRLRHDTWYAELDYLDLA
ncbi:family 43 glycosylhydrolase [Flindersiella endophytica]